MNNIDIVKDISKIKKEPKWMLDLRLKAIGSFNIQKMPKFGPKIDIDFNDITYYKKINEEVYNNWDNINKNIRNKFKDIGLEKAEKDYLGGIGIQYESETLYHNMMSYINEKKVIFLSTDEALKKHSSIFKKHFNNIVDYSDNKFSALNTAFWSGGAFIYVPKGVKLDRPLQSYFWINDKKMGQFERTIIIVDDDASLEYIEGCTAVKHIENSLHAAVVEIYVGKNAKCKYTTIQNWSNNVYNLVTKRAVVEESGTMEWIDGNIGSKITMKYPACILKGDNSIGRCITIALADKNQIQDTGAKMIHIGNNTKSTILSKSIARNGGIANYRGLVKISNDSKNSNSKVKCDTMLLDKLSKSDTYPANINKNKTSTITHEATVSKINDEQLFYLMSRGIDKEKAIELLVMGFLEKFRNELPLEYAVELNNLLRNDIPKTC